MPLFCYRVLNGKQPEELIEVEQSLDSPPLTHHPVTSEKIVRVVQSSNLVLQHGDRMESKKLTADNLEKHGFSVYEKNSDGSKYQRTIGKSGPDSIPPPS